MSIPVNYPAEPLPSYLIPREPTLADFKRPVGTSFLLHSGLSVSAWAIAAATNRVEIKDYVWPSSMVINAWWQAVGIKVVRDGLPLSEALSRLGWREKLLLTGVTAWGLRLFYRIASRSIRRGSDDSRYATDKAQPNFWLKALAMQFLPEAVFQTLISIPFTAPFRFGRSLASAAAWGWTDSLAVGLWGAGMALETLADWQLEDWKRSGKRGLYRGGVWSIVRHPNYLGDTLVHFSFPLLIAGTPSYHPLLWVGPLANYAFLRMIGGDAENEASQEKRYAEKDKHKLAQLHEWKVAKNSFWPASQEAANKWTWVVLGAGAVGVVVEQAVRSWFAPKFI